MGFGGSQDSTLANAFSRRQKINQTRQLLNLGNRGAPQPQQGPPPVLPAQDQAAPTADVAQEEPEGMPSSDQEDMLARTQQFINEIQADKLQRAISADQAVPGTDQRDGRILEAKRFMKLNMPWSLNKNGSQSQPNQ